MPTVNIYNSSPSNNNTIKKLSTELKPFVAEKLSCGDRKLSKDEISVRTITVGGEMIAEIEVEIMAYSYEERVKSQDDIANEIRDYILKTHTSLSDVRVWLILSELGHSWQE